MRNVEHLAATYREEAAERVVELEATLLDLERRPADADLVDRAFRAMHTIKGSGAMFGFDELAAFTHELETVFDRVRAGKLAVTTELVGLALEGKDLIRAMLEGGAEPDRAGRERLVAAFRRLLPNSGSGPAPTVAEPAAPAAAAGEGMRRYRIRFKPTPELLQDGTNPLGLFAELRTLGACELSGDASAVPALEELAPETCHLAWEATLTTDRGADAIRDVFIFVEDRCELSIESAGEAAPAGTASVADATGASARATPEAARETLSASVRVPAAKLDRLVDLVGELVIAQARLARLASGRDDAELLAVSEDMERLSSELRDGTLNVRMVPIGTTFSRFRRVTRDLAAELGKEIDLVADGAETELDKTVIERLGEPLVHVIRNCCDHGIEPPAARRAAGKPARGTVRLSARHSGASVLVEIGDDGAGLDPEAIRAKAVERGLLAADARLGEQELFNLVFLPGFSTARAVSSISGRGVGMDAVKGAVEALRGSVRIESARGVGTTLTIELPLTLAIIEGLLVTAGEGSYVLPLSAVEECVELTRDDVARARGARLAAVRGELVPYLRLRELFDVPGEPPPLEQIAVVRVDGLRCGLAVDAVVGQHQTVIRSLGRMYRHVKGLSGATLLGDGTVALIVDVPALVQAGAPRGREPSTHPQEIAS